MSILDEIRNRNNQPIVPPRPDVFSPQEQDDLPSDNNVQLVTTNSEGSELKKLEAELSSFPEIASRLPIRLEVEIKKELDQLCEREKITIETLLEAFYTIVHDKEPVMRQVVKEAKKRLKSRKEAGNLRSSITRLSNLTKNKK